jgi:hypothetical protein
MKQNRMSGLGNIYPLQICWLGYSASPVYIVIVMVALAEEFPVSLILLATSLLGLAVSSLEMAVSFSPDRNKPTSMIVTMIRTNSLFTSTVS